MMPDSVTITLFLINPKNIDRFMHKFIYGAITSASSAILTYRPYFIYRTRVSKHKLEGFNGRSFVGTCLK